jgi:hypothetical protein
MEPTIKLEVTSQEFSYLIQTLVKRPYEEVAGFVTKLSQQAQANALPVVQKESE